MPLYTRSSVFGLTGVWTTFYFGMDIKTSPTLSLSQVGPTYHHPPLSSPSIDGGARPVVAQLAPRERPPVRSAAPVPTCAAGPRPASVTASGKRLAREPLQLCRALGTSRA